MVAHSEYQWINPTVVMSILHRMTGRYTFLQMPLPWRHAQAVNGPRWVLQVYCAKLHAMPIAP